MIAFNEVLRETAIRDTEKGIQQLTNEVFSLHNKLENLHASQTASEHRLEELNLQSQQVLVSVEVVRTELGLFNEQLQMTALSLAEADETFKVVETNYNDSSRQYNEFNLNVTRQQSKINGLKQELEFKSNQLNDLKVQIETNTTQFGDTVNSMEQSTV